MTDRLSEDEMATAIRQAGVVCEMYDKNLYTYKVLEKGNDYVRFARALLQLRDDLDAVTRERDELAASLLEVSAFVRTVGVETLGERKVQEIEAAHAPTPEGSK